VITDPIPRVTGNRFGLIVGHSIPQEEYVTDAEQVEIPSGDGPPIILLDRGNHVVLPRHGITTFTPAHLLSPHANIAALVQAGCDRVLGIASSGSLRRDWPVGTVVAPDDFIAPRVNPTYHDGVGGHTVPGFDLVWRQSVIDTWRSSTHTPIVDGGVYVQSTGPRFETPAEVRMLATFGDLVGMTLAGECILAREVGVAYAAICTVDNLANGLDEMALTESQFREGIRTNHRRLAADLSTVLPALSTMPAPRR